MAILGFIGSTFFTALGTPAQKRIVSDANVSRYSGKSSLNGGLETMKSNLRNTPLLSLCDGSVSVLPCTTLGSEAAKLLRIKFKRSISEDFSEMSCEKMVQRSSPI